VFSGRSLFKIKHCLIDTDLFIEAYLLAFKIELVSRFSLQEFCLNGILWSQVFSGRSLFKIKHCFIDTDLFMRAYLLAIKIELVSRFSLQKFCFNGIPQNRSPPVNTSARFNLSKASRLSISYAAIILKQPSS